jgi:hypothetical protein
VDIEMKLSDNSIAWSTPLDELENPKSIRNTFRNHLSIREESLNRFNQIVNPSNQIDNELHQICKATFDNGYRILTTENKELIKIPFLFKFKSKEIKPLHSYNAKHIRSSIIKSILLDGLGEMDIRLNRALYVLYYYWFCNKNTIQSISLNVCVDLENIISTLIDKGFTLYKEYTITNDLVNSLRDKLVREKLLNESNL